MSAAWGLAIFLSVAIPLVLGEIVLGIWLIRLELKARRRHQ